MKHWEKNEKRSDKLHKLKLIGTYEIKFISQIFIITMYTILYKSLEKLIHEHTFTTANAITIINMYIINNSYWSYLVHSNLIGIQSFILKTAHYL